MTDDEKAAAAAGAFLALAIPVLLVGSSLWFGWALSVLWGWFGEPITHVHLSLGAAIGVMLLKGIVFPGHLKKKGEETEGSAFWLYLASPLIALAIGAGAHAWLMS